MFEASSVTRWLLINAGRLGLSKQGMGSHWRPVALHGSSAPITSKWREKGLGISLGYSFFTPSSARAAATMSALGAEAMAGAGAASGGGTRRTNRLG